MSEENLPDPNKRINAFWEIVNQQEERGFEKPTPKKILLHTFLFVLTFMSCSWSGLGLMAKTAIHTQFWDFFKDGMLYAALLLAFLTTHEFGHYFAAVYHRIRTTLPYFIPMPIFFIGTMGAVIRIKERIDRTHKLFDVGIAGPIAGFVVALGVLLYGFFTLPGPEFIFNFEGHNEIQNHIRQFGEFPKEMMWESDGQAMVMGGTLLYNFIASFFPDAPPMFEMYHYPFLFAGWLGLFFTALNLMPVGQLDGGHIVYSLLGRKNHGIVARVFLVFLVSLAGIGMVPTIQMGLLSYNVSNLFTGWIIWAILVFVLFRRAFKNDHTWIAPAMILSIVSSAILLYGFIDANQTSGFGTWALWAVLIVYFVKLDHPPVLIEEELSPGRKVLGWLSMLIFVLCISPNPIYIIN